MPKKKTQATKAPEYMPNDIIASDEIGGIIETCWWHDGEWNYAIRGHVAVDRDLAPPDPDRPGAMRMGNAYIAESNIKWYNNGVRWQEVTKEIEP